MQKKGQVTVFVLLGLALLFALAMLFYFRGKIVLNASPEAIEADLTGQMATLQSTIIEPCLSKETTTLTQKLLVQGGSLLPTSVIQTQGKKFTVLCQSISGSSHCLRTPLVLYSFEQLMNTELSKKISSCFDLSSYEGRNDFTFTAGDPVVNVSIHPSRVIVDLAFPVQLQRGNITVSKSQFGKVVNVPFGDLVKGANDILDSESSTGTFDPSSYSLLHLGIYRIVVSKPYPDRVYDLSLRAYPEDHFLFAVTGVAT